MYTSLGLSWPLVTQPYKPPSFQTGKLGMAESVERLNRSYNKLQWKEIKWYYKHANIHDVIVCQVSHQIYAALWCQKQAMSHNWKPKASHFQSLRLPAAKQHVVHSQTKVPGKAYASVEFTFSFAFGLYLCGLSWSETVMVLQDPKRIVVAMPQSTTQRKRYSKTHQIQNRPEMKWRRAKQLVWKGSKLNKPNGNEPVW